MQLRRYFLACLLFACLLFAQALGLAGPALAVDATNNIVMFGDWYGTTEDDNYINNNIIFGNVDMTQGGLDTLTNTGAVVGSIYLGGGGGAITSSGVVLGSIYGNYHGTGDVTIINYPSGQVTTDLNGNYYGTGNSYILNMGIVSGSVYGTNHGTGDATIINNLGAIISGNLYGNYLGAGSVSIFNYGTVSGNVFGNYQTPGTANASANNPVTITNTGTVTLDIYGNYAGTGNSTITNSGTVSQNLYGNFSGTGNSTITNSGTVTGNLYGNYTGSGSSYITNSLGGTVSGILYGNYLGVGNVSIVNGGAVAGGIFGNFQNAGTPNAAVSNTVNITNSGTTAAIFGNAFGTGDSYITNSNLATTIIGNMGGTGNSYITNSGTATIIYGNFTGTGDSYITNSGSATIIVGNNTGTGDSHITNSGSTTLIIGNVGGTGNSYITNSGTVSGTILAGPGNDTVTILPGSNVTGVVDGEAGTNTLIYQLPGTLDPTTFLAKYLNFQNLGFGAPGGGDTILTGTWNIPNEFSVNAGGTVDITGTVNAGLTTVYGTLNVYGHTLNTGSLYVGYGGTGNIYGSTNVSGDTSVDGALNVYPGGTLNTNNLWINPGGLATLYGGYVNVNNNTTVSGTLTVNNGGTLNTGALTITPEGAAYIYGLAVVSGATSVAGYLGVPSEGVLSTDSLYISQSGTALIDGTVYAGSTSCYGGLGVNGTLVSPTVLIGSTGVLWGSGQINGLVTNYGTIMPGNSIGTLSIRGGLIFEPGSLYVAELNSNGHSDLIAVEGPVSINGGRVLTALPQALYRDHFAWNILSATDGVTGSFEGVDGQPNSQTLSLHAVSYSDHVGLEVWRKPFASFGTGPGSQELGAGLDAIVPRAVSRQDNLASLIYNMDWNYDRGQIQNALNRLSPEMYTSYATAGLEGSTVFDRALQRRVSEVRLGRMLGLAEAPQGDGMMMAAADEAAPLAQPVTAGPGVEGWSFWGGGLGSWSNRAGADGRLGLRQNLGGVTAGVDGRLTDWLLVGLGGGATKSTLDWGQPYLSGGLKGMHTGVYAGAEAGGLHGQASLAFSQYEADGQRDIDLPDQHVQALGDFKARVELACLNGGYDFKWGSWLAGPTAGVRYAQIQMDSFREGGAGFMGLNVGDQDSESLTSTLGLQAASLFQWGAMQVMPKVSLDWQHEYKRSESELTASFPGYTDASFPTTGLAPVADLAILQAGLTARVQDRLSAFLDYGLSLGRSFSANSVGAGLQYQF